MKVEGFLLVLVGSLSVSAYAGQISNPGKRYSFDFPAGWSIDKKQKDFTVRAGADLAVSELPTPSPPQDADLKYISSMNQMTTLATGLCGKVAEQGIVIKGDRWRGDAFVCNNPKTAKVGARQELILTVKHRAEFHVFALTMPAGTWPKQRASYIALLRSLRFDRP